jgi:hypothetical protein
VLTTETLSAGIHRSTWVLPPQASEAASSSKLPKYERCGTIGVSGCCHLLGFSSLPQKSNTPEAMQLAAAAVQLHETVQ